MTVPRESTPDTAPVCYRHPDRQTWITCTRCERPICPDCMNSAAVGFQCPECVAQGRRSTRAATSVFGGGTEGERGTVTKTLMGINIGVWLLSLVVGIATGELSGSDIARFISSGSITDLVRWGAATPAQVYTDGQNLYLADGIATGQWWRLVTSGYLHSGILHLALNMYALWILGPYCERLLGRWRYIALYVISGIGGATAEFLLRDPGTYAVGASGSIFGLMAALIFFFRAMNMDLRPIITLLILNLAFGFFIPGISVIGHLGGAIAGGAVGAVFAFAPRGSQRSTIQIGGLIMVSIAIATAIGVKVAEYGLL